MASFDLTSYARRGAEVRITELESELEAIYQAFPDLRRDRSRPTARRADREEELALGAATEPPVAVIPRRGRGRRMTAAQRNVVGDRMRKYWAALSAAKK